MPQSATCDRHAAGAMINPVVPAKKKMDEMQKRKERDGGKDYLTTKAPSS